MRGEQHVRDLGEHRISQVLHHQLHAVRFGPTPAEHSPRLRFAGLQRNPGPAEFPPQLHQPPVVRAFVEEERPARGNAVDVKAILFQFVGEWLFDVEDAVEDARMVEVDACVGHVLAVQLHRLQDPSRREVRRAEDALPDQPLHLEGAGVLDVRSAEHRHRVAVGVEAGFRLAQHGVAGHIAGIGPTAIATAVGRVADDDAAGTVDFVLGHQPARFHGLDRLAAVVEPDIGI